MKTIFILILLIVPSYASTDSGWYNCKSWNNSGGFQSEWYGGGWGNCNSNGGGGGSGIFLHDSSSVILHDSSGVQLHS